MRTADRTTALGIGGNVAAEGSRRLVRSTSACFVAVYVLALASATRILDGKARACAAVALALTLVVAGFTTTYLLVPAGIALVALVLRR